MGVWPNKPMAMVGVCEVELPSDAEGGGFGFESASERAFRGLSKSGAAAFLDVDDRGRKTLRGLLHGLSQSPLESCFGDPMRKWTEDFNRSSAAATLRENAGGSLLAKLALEFPSDRALGRLGKSGLMALIDAPDLVPKPLFGLLDGGSLPRVGDLVYDPLHRLTAGITHDLDAINLRENSASRLAKFGFETPGEQALRGLNDSAKMTFLDVPDRAINPLHGAMDNASFARFGDLLREPFHALTASLEKISLEATLGSLSASLMNELGLATSGEKALFGLGRSADTAFLDAHARALDPLRSLLNDSSLGRFGDHTRDLLRDISGGFNKHSVEAALGGISAGMIAELGLGSASEKGLLGWEKSVAAQFETWRHPFLAPNWIGSVCASQSPAASPPIAEWPGPESKQPAIGVEERRETGAPWDQLCQAVKDLRESQTRESQRNRRWANAKARQLSERENWQSIRNIIIAVLTGLILERLKKWLWG